jgi:hypothetical protein
MSDAPVWFPGAPCNACNGYGRVELKCDWCKKGRNECPKCHGKGNVCAECSSDAAARQGYAKAANELLRPITAKIGLLALSVIGTDPAKNIWTRDDIPESRLAAFAKRYNDGSESKKTFDRKDAVAFLDCSTFFNPGVGMLLTQTDLYITYADSQGYSYGVCVYLDTLAGQAKKKVGYPADGTSYFADLKPPSGKPEALEVFIKGVWVVASALRYAREITGMVGKVRDPEMEALLDTIRKGSCNGPKGPAKLKPDEPDEPEAPAPAPAQSKPRATTESEGKWHASWSILVLLLILARGIDYFTGPETEKRAAGKTARPVVAERIETPPAEIAKAPIVPEPVPAQIISHSEQTRVEPAKTESENPVNAQVDDFSLLRQMMRAAMERDDAQIAQLVEQILAAEKPAAGDSVAARQLLQEGNEKGKNSDYASAIRVLDQAHKLDPGDVIILGNLVFYMLEAGNFQAAKARSFEMLMLNPALSSSWAGMGIAMAKTGEREWAVLAILNSMKFSNNRELNTYIASLIENEANADLKKVALRAVAMSIRK